MTDPSTSALVVLTTTETREDCVQLVGPIRSIYRWQDAIETAEEWQLWIKTQPAVYDLLEQTIQAQHPYEVPEIIALPVTAGSTAYLRWLEGELDRE